MSISNSNVYKLNNPNVSSVIAQSESDATDADLTDIEANIAETALFINNKTDSNNNTNNNNNNTNININNNNSTDPINNNNTNSTPPDTSLICLCFDLSRYSPALRFSLLSIGVFFFFLLNSYVEEYIFKNLPKFEFGWYLTFFELLCFSVFAACDRLLNFNGTNETLFQHNAPINKHLFVAIAMTASRGLTNVSLQYLNYPTQVIFKSMKLITVMIGSLFILNASFTIWEYLSAGTLVLSACLFSLGDVDTSPNYDTIGLIIVLLSLVADAAHGNTQESLLKLHKSTTSEAMLFTNLFSAILAFAVVIGKGELIPALIYCSNEPSSYPLFIIRAAVIYGGVLCFLTLIKSSGVVAATGVTTIRKILTILLSFLLFPKPFTIKHMYGVIAFIGSLLIGFYDNQLKSGSAGAKKGDRKGNK